MSKTVLLLGSGGKEHAWALALIKSNANIITWAPKINPGIKEISIGVLEAPYNRNERLLDEWLNQIDLVIIGQTSPSLEGIGDWLEEFGIEVFSPSAKNTLIEASKSYMRKFITRNEINGNIDYVICSSESDVKSYLDKSLEVAVKPDGLTGGNGVRVFGDHLKSKEEILEYAKLLISNDGKVVIEEIVKGVEFSLQGFANGEQIVFLPLVKDYKRAFNGDKGPNTASMGSCSFTNHTLPYLSDNHLIEAKQIMKDVLKALKKENGDYKGAIYGQFMITEDGPKIIEFNARMGDPEAFNIFAILETPILDLIDSLSTNSIDNQTVKFTKSATCALYLVPEGFPENTQIGQHISIPSGIENNFRIAYVDKINGKYITTKKRSFVIVGTGETISEARENVYNIIPKNFDGIRYRTDIGLEYEI
ncbi:MAG: Phosphoribosylamine--glycine ligase [Candidatus Heimdallarchaeota archaeon LC_2]|nr:MAG: Phosphoribosylamine--glycine ligase [Candidatus Heimdallarchaeota archaeon LC_2]